MYDPEVIVCYNNIKPNQLAELEQMGLQLHKQDPASLPLPPEGVAWKLYPPRLAPNRHELFIDNDLVIVRKTKKIDMFLASDAVIYTRSLHAAFGCYTSKVPASFRLNTGLFGIPPGYDFQGELLRRLDGKKKWESYFDEQGLVASALYAQPNRIEIGLKEIAICEVDDYKKSWHGCHFVGSNRTERNVAWDTFLKDNRRRSIWLL